MKKVIWIFICFFAMVLSVDATDFSSLYCTYEVTHGKYLYDTTNLLGEKDKERIEKMLKTYKEYLSRNFYVIMLTNNSNIDLENIVECYSSKPHTSYFLNQENIYLYVDVDNKKVQLFSYGFSFKHIEEITEIVNRYFSKKEISEALIDSISEISFYDRTKVADEEFPFYLTKKGYILPIWKQNMVASYKILIVSLTVSTIIIMIEITRYKRQSTTSLNVYQNRKKSRILDK